MKPPSGELLHLRDEAKAEPEHSGFTGALELYDELINFLGLSFETQQQAVSDQENAGPTAAEPVAPSSSAPLINPVTETAMLVSQPPSPNQPTAVSSEATQPVPGSANSEALSEDVIRVTGPLTRFVASQAAGSAVVVCTECGHASDSGEMFCIHCGGLLDEPAASAETAIALAGLCDDCGAMVESDEIFCPSCGTVMANA